MSPRSLQPGRGAGHWGDCGALGRSPRSASFLFFWPIHPAGSSPSRPRSAPAPAGLAFGEALLGLFLRSLVSEDGAWVSHTCPLGASGVRQGPWLPWAPVFLGLLFLPCRSWKVLQGVQRGLRYSSSRRPSLPGLHLWGGRRGRGNWVSASSGKWGVIGKPVVQDHGGARDEHVIMEALAQCWPERCPGCVPGLLAWRVCSPTDPRSCPMGALPVPQGSLGGGHWPISSTPPLPAHWGTDPGPGFQSGNAILGGTVLGGVGSLSGKEANS